MNIIWYIQCVPFHKSKDLHTFRTKQFISCVIKYHRYIQPVLHCFIPQVCKHSPSPSWSSSRYWPRTLVWTRKKPSWNCSRSTRVPESRWWVSTSRQGNPWCPWKRESSTTTESSDNSFTPGKSGEIFSGKSRVVLFTVCAVKVRSCLVHNMCCENQELSGSQCVLWKSGVVWFTICAVKIKSCLVHSVCCENQELSGSLCVLWKSRVVWFTVCAVKIKSCLVHNVCCENQELSG